MLAVPLMPSLVAVIVAGPAAMALTNPLADTVAIEVLFELHVTVRPVSTVPRASRSVALSFCMPAEFRARWRNRDRGYRARTATLQLRSGLAGRGNSRRAGGYRSDAASDVTDALPVFEMDMSR